ncbi:hypothetical protein DLM_1775 [Aquitalea magnusonii]|uniref:Uncharacterized protein n=1 Tax=Aquitalea magnusonii TaxID=332411 RepID=A0A3G9GGL9_9NEIS|nr:hypothetical protein [Aquitalea magnusonii]BBF85391.1 hypothetical protein DLM_1775 [Aquitalea magnusonii]
MAADNIMKAIPPIGWLALAGGIVAVYVLKKTAETVPVVIDAVSQALDNGAVNPTSSNNVAYGIANRVDKWFGIQDKGETVGTQIYKWMHPSEDQAIADWLAGKNSTFGNVKPSKADAAKTANAQVNKTKALYGGAGGSW